MKFRHLVAAALFALAGVAQATVQPGYVGELDNAGVEISNVVGPGSFVDYYLFNVAGGGFAGSAVISIPYPTASTFIDFNFLGFVDASGNLLAADVDPSDGFGPLFAPLAGPGLYALAISGTAGPNGGIYDGFLATAVVPEPEVAALLLAGLLAAPLVRRRRRR